MKKIFILGNFLLISLFYHNTITAHDTGEKWILIEDKSDLIIDNIIQNPSILPWAPHVFNKTFTPHDLIKFSADLEIVERNLEIEKNSILIKWNFSYGEELVDTEFEKKFEEGNYFLTAEIVDKKTLEILDSEEIMFIVGEAPTAGIIIVDNYSTDNNIYPITRSEVVTFRVKEPNSDYKYTWDLGDQEISESLEIKKQFLNTKLPAYIVLRTIDKNSNTFSDSYIRIESNENPNFEVITPAVKRQETNPPLKKSDSLKPLLIFSILSLIFVGLIYSLKKLYRKLDR